jgi:hypothetical protein
MARLSVLSYRGNLRAWWRDAFERMPDLRYEERSVTASGDVVFLVYERVVTGEPAMLVAESYEVARGRILRSRVFHG